MKWMSKPGVSKDVPDGAIVEAIMQVTDGKAPFAKTQEVADMTGMTQPGALARLKDLRDQGVIGGKRAGNGWGWWVR